MDYSRLARSSIGTELDNYSRLQNQLRQHLIGYSNLIQRTASQQRAE